MKPIKMFGLAVLAVLAAMAFVGASSAMAESTTLCSGDGSGCGVTHVHATTSVKATLLNDIADVECNVLFLGDALSGLANPLVIHGNFSYSGCTNTCTVTEGNGPARIAVLKSGTELAGVTGVGLVHVKCFFGILDCFYDGLGLEGHALGPLNSGGTNGTVRIENQEVNPEAGPGCPQQSFLDLELHPLSPLYIST